MIGTYQPSLYTDGYDRITIITHLGQIFYWYNRFELSREIDHLDNAERHESAVRDYLPKCLNNLSIIGLCNLYLNLSSPSKLDKLGG